MPMPLPPWGIGTVFEGDRGTTTLFGVPAARFTLVGDNLIYGWLPLGDRLTPHGEGIGHGCVRAVMGTTASEGWMVVETAASGDGLTMPDYARVLAQLGATNVMGFDSNSHADFWRTGATPITSGGAEPPAPAATLLSYH